MEEGAKSSAEEKLKETPVSDEEKQIEVLKKKFEQIKDKLEKLKTKLLGKFEEYIIAIALLPPEKKDSKEISVLVLIDDSDVKKMTRWELKDKLTAVINNLAADIDKDIKPDVMLMTELREICFDGKYDILQLISASVFVHDPKDVLKALKVSEIHKTMVLKKFEKYVVSYVAVGSLFRGDARSNDIDVAVVIDDTDVKKMSRFELRDKLGAIIRTLGYDASSITNVKKSFHIQVYILTDFWEAIKEASPVIFTFLRDGIPLYDRGIFNSWKLLLEMGRIKPSPEAIDMHMDMGSRLIERAKGKMLGIVAEDIYYACLNPSQAALMLYGVPPPTPRETIRLMEEIFVHKEKMLEKKYVTILAKTFKFYKDIEHTKIKEVKGKDLDILLKDSEMFLKRINTLFSQIEKRTEKKRALSFYDNTMKIIEDLLHEENIKYNSIESGFKKLCASGKFPKQYLSNFKEILKIRESYSKLTKQEVEKILRENAFLVRVVIDYLQRKKGVELERAKIGVKYGQKFAEVYLFDDTAYIIDDINAAEKKISRAKLLPSGGLDEIKDSNLDDLEKSLKKFSMPKNVFIKEKIFEDLRKLFGSDVEILINR